MNEPAVSVVMAAYNGARFVGETIASLRAQRFTDWELVVVDDRSTDETLGVLRSIDDPRMRVIAAERNGGPVAARNRAFAEARGRYIAGLDQDDICHPDRLGVQVAYLDAHRDVVLVGANANILCGGRVRPGNWARATTPGFLDWTMRLLNPLAWSTVMFRAEAARALDVFERQERLYAEDFDLYHRLRVFGRIARIDAPLLDYRVHRGGASQRFTEAMHAASVQVIADAQRPILGDEADGIAPLASRHLMAGAPVPDLATLDRLFAAAERIAAHLAAIDPPDAATKALIEAEQSRLWWRAVRTAVRAGRFGLGEALQARPSTARLEDKRVADLAFSHLVGRSRALGRATGLM